MVPRVPSSAYIFQTDRKGHASFLLQVTACEQISKCGSILGERVLFLGIIVVCDNCFIEKDGLLPEFVISRFSVEYTSVFNVVVVP